jgi:hypothetical protein
VDPYVICSSLKLGPVSLAITMAYNIKQRKKKKKDSPKRTLALSADHLDLILNLLPFTGLKGWVFGTGGRVCFMRTTAGET